MFNYTMIPERLQVKTGMRKPPLVTESFDKAAFKQPSLIKAMAHRKILVTT